MSQFMRLKREFLEILPLGTTTKCLLRSVTTKLKAYLQELVRGLMVPAELRFLTMSKNPFRLHCHRLDFGVLFLRFALELSRLREFVEAVKAIVKKTPTAFPLQGILMRFSDKSDILMSTAYGRQTVHFEFYLWNRKDVYNRPSGSLAGYQTILQTLV